MTAHLGTDELIDLLSDNVPAAVPDSVSTGVTVAHLAACAVCRQELQEMRAVLNEVRQTEIPEPSPLFWDHFSARVRRAVEADREQSVGAIAWRGIVPAWLVRPSFAGLAVVSLAALVAASAWFVPAGQHDSPGLRQTAQTAAVETPTDPNVASEDASLALVADLAAELDWDAARDAGFTTHVGADDDAVNVLTSDERGELRRLLQDELHPSRRGA
jgi:hypothetical protein